MRQLWSALFGLVGRGRITRARSGPDQQEVQVVLTADELKDDMEHIEPFGLTACPVVGAEAVALFVGGDRSNGLVLAVADRRYRITGLLAGEVAVYNATGHKVVLYQDRIEVTAPKIVMSAEEEVFIDSPLLRAAGQIVAAQDISDNDGSGGATMAAMREAYNSHHHVENNQSGGKTDVPDQQV